MNLHPAIYAQAIKVILLRYHKIIAGIEANKDNIPNDPIDNFTTFT
jgi:hypothetical protein